MSEDIVRREGLWLTELGLVMTVRPQVIRGGRGKVFTGPCLRDVGG